MAKNEHVSQYLDYYLGMESSPEFAILLKGEWGVGKTWYLRKYLEERHVDHLYISLNGVSTSTEIEDQFYRELHPVLASKQMKFVSKLVKGLLKTTIHLDLDADKKPDLNVGSSLPDINLPDFLNNLNNKLLVFDDLERCSMPVPNILGYINQFVEGNGLKVIILANEEEIIRSEKPKENEPSQYQLIREKLIGRTFMIESDPETGLEDFLSHLSSKEVRRLLIQKKEVLLETYYAAGYHNLRHLRQAILDFERFYQFLPAEVYQIKELTDHLLRLFFAIAIEMRKGFVEESHLPDLLSPYTSRLSPTTATPVSVAKAKHLVFSGVASPILVEDWEQFFKTGSIDADRVKQSILQSNYFDELNTPDWEKLWRYFDMEDNAFEELSSRLFKCFQSRQMRDRYEIVHLTGIFLALVNQQVLESTTEEILQLGRENLLACKENGGLRLVNPMEQFPDPNGFKFGYHSMDNAEFLGFLKYASNLSSEYMAEISATEAQVLLRVMKRSVLEFSSTVTLSHIGTSKHFNSPILHKIPVADFLNAYFELSAPAKRELARVIDKRYDLDEYAHLLLEELSWLKALLAEGQSRIGEGTRKLSIAILESTFLPAVERAITRLTRLKKPTG